jgi:hypothetical protein
MILELCIMTHNELKTITVKWLKRPSSGNGPGCQLALSEVGGLYGGERAWLHTYEQKYGELERQNSR